MQICKFQDFIQEVNHPFVLSLTWIPWHMQTKTPMPKHPTSTKIKKLELMCHMSHITCHRSPTVTTVAIDPPLAHAPTMHIRLICQDRNGSLAKPASLPKTKNKFNPDCQNIPDKEFLVSQFWQWAVWPKISSPCNSRSWLRGQTNKSNHIMTYRLNQPWDQISEESFICFYFLDHCELRVS